RRQLKGPQIQATIATWPFGCEKGCLTISTDMQTAFLSISIDGITEVFSFRPVSFIIHATDIEVPVAHSRPSIGSKVKRFIIGMIQWGYLISGSIDCRTQIFWYRPAAIRIQFGCPDIIRTVATRTITHKIQGFAVGTDGRLRFPTRSIDGSTEVKRLRPAITFPPR